MVSPCDGDVARFRPGGADLLRTQLLAGVSFLLNELAKSGQRGEPGPCAGVSFLHGAEDGATGSDEVRRRRRQIWIFPNPSTVKCVDGLSHGKSMESCGSLEDKEQVEEVEAARDGEANSQEQQNVLTVFCQGLLFDLSNKAPSGTVVSKKFLSTSHQERLVFPVTLLVTVNS